MKNILLILLSVLLAVFGQVFLKKGMMDIGEIPFNLSTPFFLISKVFTNFKLFVGFTLFGLSSVVWLVVLSKVALSFAYPMVSTGYILTLLISWKFLGETISPVRWIAVMIICGGVALLARN